jgi:hypothetical protein
MSFNLSNSKTGNFLELSKMISEAQECPLVGAFALYPDRDWGRGPQVGPPTSLPQVNNNCIFITHLLLAHQLKLSQEGSCERYVHA